LLKGTPELKIMILVDRIERKKVTLSQLKVAMKKAKYEERLYLP
jgi:hypothetical protein